MAVSRSTPAAVVPSYPPAVIGSRSDPGSSRWRIGRCSIPAPPAIVVGRTLSSYFVGDVQNNQETDHLLGVQPASDPETGVLADDGRNQA